MGRNQIQKNYFQLTPLISRCPNKNGAQQTATLKLNTWIQVFSKAKRSSQWLLNLISWPGKHKCLTILWLREENKQGWTYPVMACLQQTIHITLKCEETLPASPVWEVSGIYELLWSMMWIWGLRQALSSGKHGQFSFSLPAPFPITDCTILKWIMI